MSELGIGEVARRTGLAASALRFYEAEGLIPRAGRRGGRRVYGEGVLDRLRLIAVAKAAGFTVAEIKRLLGGFSKRTPPGERWRVLARRKLDELDQRISEAERMKRVLEAVTRCACPSLDDCARALAEDGSSGSGRGLG